MFLKNPWIPGAELPRWALLISIGRPISDYNRRLTRDPIITLSEDLLDAIDKRSGQFKNRSDFIEAAMSVYIERIIREEQNARDTRKHRVFVVVSRQVLIDRHQVHRILVGREGNTWICRADHNGWF